MAVADQSRWRVVLTDLNGNRPAGAGVVNNAGAKTYAYVLNGAKTMGVTMNIDNPVANFALANDALMKVYRKARVSGAWQLDMVGDVIAAEETASGDVATVTVTGTDSFFRLQHRLIGLGVDALGRGVGWSDGTVSAQKDAGQIIADLVNAIGSCGLNPVAAPASLSYNTYVGPVYAKVVADAITEIVNTLGGPDIEIVAQEPSGTMPATVIASLVVHGSTTGGLGVARPNCVFEYGCGSHNVQGWDRLVSKDGLANAVYSLPQGFPTTVAAGDTVLTQADIPSVNALGYWEDVVNADLTTVAMRNELMSETLAVRKSARQVIQVTPSVDCNLDYLTDYRVGDVVQVRAVAGGSLRVNGSVRIFGVGASVDENDAETITLTLAHA